MKMIHIVRQDSRTNVDWNPGTERPAPCPAEGSHVAETLAEPICGACRACGTGCLRGLQCCLGASVAGCRGCSRCGRHLKRQGWRKWCLFGLITLLIMSVLVNMAVTLWIMKIMEFNYSGMGPLRIHSGGVELSGKTYIMDSLIASSIQSRNGESLNLDSYDNFTVTATSPDGKVETRLFIDNEKLECHTNNLIIEDDDGNVLFSSNLEEVSIRSKSLRIIGEGGVIFDSSVETPHVGSHSGHDLRLESLTRSMSIEAAQSILLESKAGGIDVSTLKDIHFKSRAGVIKIDSRKMFLTNLEIAHASSSLVKAKHKTKIYQVCVCENGRLFLAEPTTVCEIYDAVFLCRP